jgi:hypothetical protein
MKIRITAVVDLETSEKFRDEPLGDPRLLIQRMAAEGKVQLHSLNHWLALKSLEITETGDTE